jgi:hypothetical protein
VQQQILPPAPPEVGLAGIGLYLVAAVLVIAFTRGKLGQQVAAEPNAAHYRSLAVHS